MRYDLTYVATPTLVWVLAKKNTFTQVMKQGLKPDHKNPFHLKGRWCPKILYAVKAGDDENLIGLKVLLDMPEADVITAAVPSFYQCFKETPESEIEKLENPGPKYRGILIIPDKIKAKYIKGIDDKFLTAIIEEDTEDMDESSRLQDEQVMENDTERASVPVVPEFQEEDEAVPKASAGPAEPDTDEVPSLQNTDQEPEDTSFFPSDDIQEEDPEEFDLEEVDDLEEVEDEDEDDEDDNADGAFGSMDDFDF